MVITGSKQHVCKQISLSYKEDMRNFDLDMFTDLGWRATVNLDAGTLHEYTSKHTCNENGQVQEILEFIAYTCRHSWEKVVESSIG